MQNEGHITFQIASESQSHVITFQGSQLEVRALKELINVKLGGSKQELQQQQQNQQNGRFYNNTSQTSPIEIIIMDPISRVEYPDTKKIRTNSKVLVERKSRPADKFSTAGVQRQCRHCKEQRNLSYLKCCFNQICVNCFDKKNRMSKCPLCLQPNNMANIPKNALQTSKEELDIISSNARFFIIRSANQENINIAKEICQWATTKNNERRLDEAFMTSMNVIFFFRFQQRDTNFQGLARMDSIANKNQVDYREQMMWKKQDHIKLGGNFKIRWLRIGGILDQGKVYQMINTINKMPILQCRDCSEVGPFEGKQLCMSFEHPPQQQLQQIQQQQQQQQQQLMMNHTQLQYPNNILQSNQSLDININNNNNNQDNLNSTNNLNKNENKDFESKEQSSQNLQFQKDGSNERNKNNLEEKSQQQDQIAEVQESDNNQEQDEDDIEWDDLIEEDENDDENDQQQQKRKTSNSSISNKKKSNNAANNLNNNNNELIEPDYNQSSSSQDQENQNQKQSENNNEQKDEEQQQKNDNENNNTDNQNQQNDTQQSQNINQKDNNNILSSLNIKNNSENINNNAAIQNISDKIVVPSVQQPLGFMNPMQFPGVNPMNMMNPMMNMLPPGIGRPNPQMFNPMQMQAPPVANQQTQMANKIMQTMMDAMNFMKNQQQEQEKKKKKKDKDKKKKKDKKSKKSRSRSRSQSKKKKKDKQ